MQFARQTHACGLAKDPIQQEAEVIVFSGSNGGLVTSTEIYNVADNTWRSGPPFLEDVNYLVTVQDGRNSFFAMGGYITAENPDEYLDTIYRFDEDTREFVMMEYR